MFVQGGGKPTALQFLNCVSRGECLTPAAIVCGSYHVDCAATAAIVRGFIVGERWSNGGGKPPALQLLNCVSRGQFAARTQKERER